MKLHKKSLIGLFLTGTLLFSSAPVFAANQHSQFKTELKEKRAELKQKREERKQNREALKQEIQILKSNREQNRQLNEQIKLEIKRIRGELKQYKENAKANAQKDVKPDFTAVKTKIHEVITAVDGIRGVYKNATQAVLKEKEQIKKENFEAAMVTIKDLEVKQQEIIKQKQQVLDMLKGVSF
jgi:chromosome segregation ATPase